MQFVGPRKAGSPSFGPMHTEGKPAFLPILESVARGRRKYSGNVLGEHLQSGNATQRCLDQVPSDDNNPCCVQWADSCVLQDQSILKLEYGLGILETSIGPQFLLWIRLTAPSNNMNSVL